MEHSKQLEAVVDVWLDNRPVATQKNYRNVIDVANREALGVFQKGLLELDKFQLQRIASTITAHYKSNSKGTVYAILRSFFLSVQEMEVRMDNPSIHLKSPKTPTRTAQKIMTLEEVKWLVAVAKGETRLLIQVLYGAGLRAGELCGLKVGDFNPLRRTLFVVGKGSKERTVTISGELNERLAEFVKGRDLTEPLFKAAKRFRDGSPRPLRTPMVWHRVKKLAKKAGIRGVISTHWIRHTHATHALENGMDLRDLSRTLGHSSVLVTQKHYDHAITKSSPSEFLPSI